MPHKHRFAIVITHTGPRNDIVEMPWLETECHIDESDWIVLSDEGWRDVADGNPEIWDALKRKLLIGYYVSQPQLVAVIGHPSDAGDHDHVAERQAQVCRIVDRVKSLLLPAGVMGLWTDEHGDLQDILEPPECGECERTALQPAN